ncbi:hypothetical protein ACFFRE_11225 [Aciditerrimonas ferrireducens]|jgi:hypothetical protein|uniref:Uncharacterized protein n=1 Tax=Aciditerrimonas ferrireducens TaxID=667306 RepID=A0ABV6C4V6_9ACTN|nr:hypothetical protein [Aciditerrimonas ferrireducens]MCK4177926.1 hypothetical protein [Aciditerrimonas ferrireducens]
MNDAPAPQTGPGPEPTPTGHGGGSDLAELLRELEPGSSRLPVEPPSPPPTGSGRGGGTAAQLLRNVLGAVVALAVATMVALVVAQSVGAVRLGWLGSDGPPTLPSSTTSSGLAR